MVVQNNRSAGGALDYVTKYSSEYSQIWRVYTLECDLNHLKSLNMSSQEFEPNLRENP